MARETMGAAPREPPLTRRSDSVISGFVASGRVLGVPARNTLMLSVTWRALPSSSTEKRTRAMASPNAPNASAKRRPPMDPLPRDPSAPMPPNTTNAIPAALPRPATLRLISNRSGQERIERFHTMLDFSVGVAGAGAAPAGPRRGADAGCVAAVVLFGGGREPGWAAGLNTALQRSQYSAP